MSRAGSDSLTVTLRRQVDDSYEIHIGQGALAQAPAQAVELLGRSGHREFAVISDETVASLYADQVLAGFAAAGARAELFTVPAGEGSKSLDAFGGLIAAMRAAGFTRKACVVALGGGMTGDLAGFTAGCYMRGVPFVQLPTTLLAQVDSSVGGKVAVNVPGGKNDCGLFYQPRLVCIDTATLDSLPERELASGLAEVAKYAVIEATAGATAVTPENGLAAMLLEQAPAVLARDPELLARIIHVCCAIKRDVVQADEREGGVRRILNYGHTVGHALEDHFHYELTHGECVAYGMRAAARLGRELGLCDAPFEAEQDRLLAGLGLARGALEFPDEAIVARMYTDKKAVAGKLVMVLPRRMGRVEVCEDVDEAALRRALNVLKTAPAI